MKWLNLNKPRMENNAHLSRSDKSKIKQQTSESSWQTWELAVRIQKDSQSKQICQKELVFN